VQVNNIDGHKTIDDHVVIWIFLIRTTEPKVYFLGSGICAGSRATSIISLSGKSKFSFGSLISGAGLFGAGAHARRFVVNIFSPSLMSCQNVPAVPPLAPRANKATFIETRKQIIRFGAH
jgi:hypothetical protein